jgi:hypothetical protein
MKKRGEGANEMGIRVQRAAAPGFVRAKHAHIRHIDMDGSDQTMGARPARAFGL